MLPIGIVASAAKALVPLQPQLRRLKRRIVPYRDNPNNSALALADGLEQVQLLRAAGATFGDVLEFGTGWLPIIPFLFCLAGARQLVLTDVERLLDRQTIERAKRYIRENAHIVAAALRTPAPEILARLDAALSRYHAPWDCGDQPSHSVDIITSRAALEHIPPRSLDSLFDEFRRIVRPNGFMCHIVDNSDHWEHQDKRLSRVNFLRYEEGWCWRLACLNVQSYQNRLRHSDYLALFRRHGWEIVAAEGEPDRQCLKDLRTLPLASDFAHRDRNDLAILRSAFVLRRR